MENKSRNYRLPEELLQKTQEKYPYLSMTEIIKFALVKLLEEGNG